MYSNLCIHVIFILKLCFVAESSSSSQGVISGEHAWRALIATCFRTPAPRFQNTYFTARAVDDFRDVAISFLVSSSDGKCSLVWDDWMSFVGGIRSLKLADLSPVPKAIASGWSAFGFNLDMTEVKIDIYNGKVPHWEVVSLYPQNLVSGKFIRSLIAEGIAEHRSFRGHMQINLRILDTSNIREMYFLEHGRTYFENVWNMNYDCILLESIYRGFIMTQFTQNDHFARSAGPAFADRDMSYINRVNPGSEEPRQLFSEIFRREMTTYIATKMASSLQLMTIRQAVNEFVPRWKYNPSYGLEDKKTLAANTIMFFFRHHTNWDLIAREALEGFDTNCNMMTGIPISDGRTFQFIFTLQPVVPPRAGPSPDEEESQSVDTGGSRSTESSTHGGSNVSPSSMRRSFSLERIPPGIPESGSQAGPSQEEDLFTSGVAEMQRTSSKRKLDEPGPIISLEEHISSSLANNHHLLLFPCFSMVCITILYMHKCTDLEDATSNLSDYTEL